MIAPNAQERLTQIVEPLLFWYQKNKRSLPWRDQPTPYRVWVSEIMLQQTRVEAVKPYFERFLSQLPSIQALASCPEDRLLKLWEGLGYYSRARNLQKAARHIFTHIEWQMSCLLVKTGDSTLSRSQIDRLLPEDFLLTDRLDSVSLPSAFQSYTSLLTTLIGSY